jgi:hypothetical protein
MPAALQCPDCGHQEMLDNLGGVTTFRCGGCGRALKIPAQFRGGAEAPGSAPGRRPPAPGGGEPTQALPKVPPVAAAPTTRPVSSVPPVAAPVVGANGDAPPPADVPPAPAVRPPRPTPESLKPPLILRLILWVIALPLGSLVVFGLATSFKVLTRSQLEDTFLRADWARFTPIARLLPFCALATALIVQLGVFGLERLRARNLSRGARGGSGGGPPRRGPTRPHVPGGAPQRLTNGERSRDRVTS